MKNYFLLIALTYSVNGICKLNSRLPYSPPVLDTVKVYNVYCSYSDGIKMTAWGGNYTTFYPAEECPDENVEKYVENYKVVAQHLASQKFFWMKLYNTKDQLIFESLKYADCRIGRFKCYWPNGKLKLTGQYDGVVIKKKTGEYILKKCAGDPVDTWCHYDKNGLFVEYELH